MMALNIKEEVKNNGFTLLWTIENFPYSTQRPGEIIASPIFEVSGVGHQYWHLLLYPRGFSANGSVTGLILRGKGIQDKSQVSFQCETSFLSKNNEVLRSNTINSTLFVIHARDYELANSVPHSEMLLGKRDQYLPQDTLTVKCKIWRRDEDFKAGELCLIRTRIGIGRKSFDWSISNFSKMPPIEERKVLLSPTCDEIPSLMLTFMVRKMASDEELIVELSLGESRKRVSVFCKIGIWDIKGNVCQLKENDHLFENEGDIWTFPLLVKLSDVLSKKDTYLHSDRLILHCSCVVSVGVTFNKFEGIGDTLTSPIVKSTDCLGLSVEDQSMIPQHSLSTDLQVLFEDGSFTDKQLRTETTEFNLHKNILAARSPVFKAMFTNDMIEKTSLSDTISDLEDETLKNLLFFMYTDRVEDLQMQNALKLYAVADKYDVASLRQFCRTFLINQMAVSNACEILILADLHNDVSLKKRVHKFILNRGNAVFASDEWQLLMERNVKLAAEVMYEKCLQR